jgi:hypothetical protein
MVRRLLDATPIPLKGNGFPWAEANARPRGLKLHLLYDSRQRRPVWFEPHAGYVPAALPSSDADHAEGGDAVGEDPAQLAIEIGLARAERLHGRGERRIFAGPVEAVRVSNFTAPRSSRACMR